MSGKTTFLLWPLWHGKRMTMKFSSPYDEFLVGNYQILLFCPFLFTVYFMALCLPPSHIIHSYYITYIHTFIFEDIFKSTDFSSEWSANLKWSRIYNFAMILIDEKAFFVSYNRGVKDQVFVAFRMTAYFMQPYLQSITRIQIFFSTILYWSE